MIYGVGTDIIHIDRIKILSEDYNDPFFRKVFTPAEYEEAISRPKPYLKFCTLFAAKEAVYKALSSGGSPCKLEFPTIEILTDQQGAPSVRFYGEIASYAETNGLDVKVSVSYDDEYAVAFAVCQK